MNHKTNGRKNVKKHDNYFTFSVLFVFINKDPLLYLTRSWIYKKIGDLMSAKVTDERAPIAHLSPLESTN